YCPEHRAQWEHREQRDRAICARLDAGERQAVVAADFGLSSANTVCKIASRQRAAQALAAYWDLTDGDSDDAKQDPRLPKKAAAGKRRHGPVPLATGLSGELRGALASWQSEQDQQRQSAAKRRRRHP